MPLKPRHSLAALAVLALAACGDGGPREPGAISEGEAAALEEAAKMLDEKRLPEGALPDLDPPAQPAPDTPEETPE